MNKAFLIILDGWGHGPDKRVSAISRANTPFMDSMYSLYPNAELITYGEKVGLPEGQMGNSEVGHLNLGAGRVVYQELARINKSIKEGELQNHPELLTALEYAGRNDKKIHLLGLVSDGGVHSHINHLIALCEIISKYSGLRTYIHAFTDGRDTDPKSGKSFIHTVLQTIKNTEINLGTLIGRYYAMDRDQRWERIKKSYDLLIKGEGIKTDDPEQEIENQYQKGITDEFLSPILVDEQSNIEPGDVVLFFNFRTDRPRALMEVLSQKDRPEKGMAILPLYVMAFSRYDDRFRDLKVLYEKADLTNTLGEVISNNGGNQIRIAETEKYPHVTYFFNGGREASFPGEKRIMIPSPKVPTYDLQPEMSAPEVKEAILQAIPEFSPDFICLNFANADMVGHTGSMEAAIKAVESVDKCLSEIVPLALQYNYYILIIADHGNADFMINLDGSPNTAHTMNPVPLILVSNDAEQFTVADGKLGDIAPTILRLMQLETPPEMDGHVLVKKKMQ